MLFVYSRYIGGKFRKLSYKWLQECTWMRYSVKKDGVMCAPCFLFVTSKGRPFINSDRDWKNMSILVQRHKIDKGHFSAQTMADHFLDVRARTIPSISCSISTAHQQQIGRNRHILMQIIKTLLVLGRLNIAIRGHTEDKSNFLALLNHTAANVVILKDHLNNPARVKYTSPDIQNEILNICAQQVLTLIINQCKESGGYSIMADGCQDTPCREQLSVCIRYITKTAGATLVMEDFIGFVTCTMGLNCRSYNV